MKFGDSPAELLPFIFLRAMPGGEDKWHFAVSCFNWIFVEETSSVVRLNDTMLSWSRLDKCIRISTADEERTVE